MSSVYALRLKSMANQLLVKNNFISETAKILGPEQTISTDTKHNLCLNYKLLEKIGEGTYGKVYKALNFRTGKVVAIKRIINQLFNEEIIRNEINLLKQIRHKNVIQLMDRFDSEDTICSPNKKNNKTLVQYLVFEFCDFDLRQILYELQIKFNFAQIKNILQQILEGVAYVHSHQVLHRDIKPENILINRSGLVRIADFGFAQSLNSYSWSGFSSKVVTLAYRAPELLVGYRFYGTAIDMWSIGCIMAELWTRSGPLMTGGDEYQQLIMISKLCGPINSYSVLGVENMYFMSDLYIPQLYRRKVRQMFAIKCMDDSNAMDLFDRLLCLNINQRITAEKALNHSLFTTEPKPMDISKTINDFNCDLNIDQKSENIEYIKKL